jgi:hypothetical protein
MTRPQRFMTRMVLFLIAVVIVVGWLAQQIVIAFQANPALNGLIGGVLLIGIIYVFRQVFMLRREVDWIETYRANQPGLSVQKPPILLGPMAAMLEGRGERMSLSALSTRSLLDGIASRLDESRDISRYLIGLLIFLGLLGTFWGLLLTIGSIAETIRTLPADSRDFAALFGTLQKGLEAPLTGMGTAFSSSLFGLAGSLVLGFLDLQASQAQNRFYNDLEEWLSRYTRLSSGGGLAEGEHSVPAYVQALLEQTADSLQELQRTMARGEDSRISANTTLLGLSEKIAGLTDQMRTEQSLMVKLAETLGDIRPILQNLGSDREQAGGLDDASRNHLRNLDVYVMQLLEEGREGRNQLSHDIRNEIKLLARTIAAIADEEREAARQRRNP